MNNITDSQLNKSVATLPGLISNMARRYSDKTAVVSEDQHLLTYSELENQSNKLANRLSKMGAGPGKLVGIYLERSLDMMVGLLGILKSGAAYIPLDPAYPAERISYMLEDSGAHLVVTKSALVDTLQNYAGAKLCLDTDQQVINQESEAPLSQRAGAEDLAYVIYTSGSTGRPKGVEIPHRAVVNFLCSMQEKPGMNENDRLLAVTTLSFDIAGLELYLPLTVGAQVIIASRTSAVDGNILGRMIREHNITVMQATPATWRLLLDSEWTGNIQLRILCGGEALPRELAAQLLPKCAELWNLYGPTETTIWSTVCRIENTDNPISIGHPIANTEIQILGENLQPVSPGTSGELYIGGDGLARGYLNRRELTEERFITHPLNPDSGARLYRTGDLARYRPDGALEHLGRVDYQVKVRGFRIELGEIESALNQLPMIKQSVVLAREDVPGDKRLVAYVIFQSAEQSAGKILRESLSATLPDYMVPGFYVAMDTFPLTPNGKIDRNAFPAPESGRPELATEYVAPQNKEESRLVSIWSKVLRIDTIGINDNFFDLGGDSLKVAQVATRIRDAFNVDIPLRLIFEGPTISDLVQAIAKSDTESFSDLPFRKVSRDGYIPLTFAQERVWFLHQLNPRNLAYNFISTIAFNGSLDVIALERSLREILRRHESYRTTFPMVEGRPVQIIHDIPDYHLDIIDLSDEDFEKQKENTDAWSQKEYQHRFDLAKLPLVRWTLLRYSDKRNVLVHMEHHLVHDGWAFNLFIRELVALYNAYTAGQPSPLNEPPIQLAEFATWQHEWMQGAVSDHQLSYWKEKFSTIPPVLELPTKGSRPPSQTFRGTSLRPEIPLDVCNGLRALSKQEGSTLFMTMLSGFIALLHRYTGESDVAVGTFFANRRKFESESVIGMILNNVVIRATLDKNPTIRELIHHIRNTVLEDASYQDVPFDRVVDAVQPKRDLSMNPLFQVMFSFHDEPMPESGMTDLDVNIMPVISNGSSKFDLGVIGIPHSAQKLGLAQGSENDGLTMIWEHNTDLFETSTIARMVEHYKMLLRAMISKPDLRLSQIALSDDDERKTILESWNDTASVLEPSLTLHGLVEQTSRTTPNATAVVFKSEQITYQTLIQQVNQLANYLMRNGVQPNALVGLCVDRSPRMLIGMLAIMKTGSAYVPIDPKFPLERQSFILKDAGIGLLITEGNLCVDLSVGEEVSLINFDTEADAIGRENTELDKIVNVSADALAYVIFTSGSTGLPKGVQIPHKAIVNLLCSMQKKPGFGSDGRFFAVTTLSFDIAGLELYLPLVAGGCVIICPRSVASNGEELANQLKKTGATMMQATPTTWQLLIDTGWKGDKNLTALCGGEAFPQSLAEQLLQRVKSLWNMYGPTETTVWSTIHEVTSADTAIPIGRPIDNTKIFILDQYNNVVPPGVIGELCIGGLGLSNGYLNRPGLTREKFIDNPVEGEMNSKMFRTGDLARYKEDGTLECLGRTDHQIKLRGFRIELGEIESLIEKLDGVRQSVVIAREDVKGDKRLIAYVVASETAQNSSEILTKLKSHLPDYMMPSACLFLDTIPLTPNGKIDRKALPAPSRVREENTNTYVAPRNDLERKLVSIWEEILSVSPVGVQDDFFDVGGHSLLAVRLVAKIEEKIGGRVSLAVLLQERTIESVAKTLSENNEKITPSSFIPHRTNGIKPPFFAAGSHPKYAEIPRHLGEDQPFYQLDLYALLTERMEKGLEPFIRIEDFAEYYIQKILSVCPQGPYSLGGGCEGAYLAYEIAVRLQEMGHEISALIMWIPPALRESKGFSLRRYASYLSLERIRYLITGGTLLKSNWHSLRVLAKHEILEYRINQALCAYAPSKGFRGNITLIRTAESPFVTRIDINRPWLDRATEGGSIHIVKGNHGNWLYDNLNDFVGIIDNSLRVNSTLPD